MTGEKFFEGGKFDRPKGSELRDRLREGPILWRQDLAEVQGYWGDRRVWIEADEWFVVMEDEAWRSTYGWAVLVSGMVEEGRKLAGVPLQSAGESPPPREVCSTNRELQTKVEGKEFFVVMCGANWVAGGAQKELW
jgi:hypothetical protein